MSKAKFQSNLMHIQSNMLNFAYMLTSNRDDAYDLLQDTTMQVLDSGEKASGPNFKNWVFGMMRNIFASRYGHVALHRAQIAENYTGTLTAYATIAEVPANSYDAHYAGDMINRFESYYREPFSMHVAGYSYKEIARKLDTRVSDVKKRIAHAHFLLAQSV